jgi:hypothetical protein
MPKRLEQVYETTTAASATKSKYSYCSPFSSFRSTYPGLECKCRKELFVQLEVKLRPSLVLRLVRKTIRCPPTRP